MTEMTQAEFSEKIGAAIEAMTPEQFQLFIAELDRRAPGIPEVEIAFMYEANPEFKEYLQDKCR